MIGREFGHQLIGGYPKQDYIYQQAYLHTKMILSVTDMPFSNWKRVLAYGVPAHFGIINKVMKLYSIPENNLTARKNGMGVLPANKPPITLQLLHFYSAALAGILQQYAKYY